MNIYSLYRRSRVALSSILILSMTITFLLSAIFFSREPTRAESASLIYNLAMLFCVAWLFASTGTRIVMLQQKEKRYRWLNISSLVFLVLMYIAVAASPASPDETFSGMLATLRSIEHLSIDVWIYGTMVVELAEIFL